MLRLPFLLLILSFRLASAAPAQTDTDSAVFAGGAFWCLEAAFEAVPGVDSVEAGYTGGTGSAPTFDALSSGDSVWVQAVRVHYRPSRVGYKKLLDTFWRNIDPTRADGQFTDEGAQYRTVVFFGDESQRKVAEAVRDKLAKSKRFAKPIVTEVLKEGEFFRAEAEHQDYAKRNGPRYRAYYQFSGRDGFFRKAWGKAKAGGNAKPGPVIR